MSLVLPSEKGSALTCEEYQNNILFSLDLANATGELNCSKISSASLNTCLSETNVISSINGNITNNANAIGEVAQDLSDVQSLLQSNIDAITILVNTQNATIAEQATQIATLIEAFNALQSTVAAFNSRLLSVEGRLTTLENAIAAGIIVVWSGSIVSIPNGWFLCNGQNSTPDLRDRFIVGAGTTYAVNAVGGVASHTHTITGTSGGTSLTQSQLPDCALPVTDPSHSHPNVALLFYIGNVGNGAGLSRPVFNTGESIIYPAMSQASATTNITVRSGGSNAAHTHSFSSTTATTSNIPPYYALAYIMKI